MITWNKLGLIDYPYIIIFNFFEKSCLNVSIIIYQAFEEWLFVHLSLIALHCIICFKTTEL